MITGPSFVDSASRWICSVVGWIGIGRREAYSTTTITPANHSDRVWLRGETSAYPAGSTVPPSAHRQLGRGACAVPSV
jgi:hypothetical protein